MSESEAVRISVIIPTWNARDYLRRALASLEEHFPANVPHEIIVVDNASEDGTAEMVRQEFPRVILVVNDDNLGPVGARHVGVEQARGEDYLFIDSDIECLPGACEPLMAAFEEDPRLAFVTCNKQSPDGYPQRSWFDVPTLWTTCAEMIPVLRSRRIEKSRAAHDTPCFPGWISTGHSLVRGQAWSEINGQNRAIFFFGEEIEFCQRLRDHGWKVGFIPHLGFLHHGSVSQRGHEDRFRKLSWLGMLWIADLYWPLWKTLCLRGLLFMRGLLVCLKKLVKGESPGDLAAFLPRLLWPIPVKEVKL